MVDQEDTLTQEVSGKKKLQPHTRRELCETVGKNNATANREWLRRKIKELDKQIEELSGL